MEPENNQEVDNQIGARFVKASKNTGLELLRKLVIYVLVVVCALAAGLLSGSDNGFMVGAVIGGVLSFVALRFIPKPQ